jgi:hypothetical protein
LNNHSLCQFENEYKTNTCLKDLEQYLFHINNTKLFQWLCSFLFEFENSSYWWNILIGLFFQTEGLEKMDEKFQSQIVYTKELLKNYYEKKPMYELNQEEKNFKIKLEMEHEQEKNPTILGSFIQNMTSYLFSFVKNTKAETFLRNFSSNDQFITEFDEIQKLENENFKITKDPIIWNPIIKIKHNPNQPSQEIEIEKEN